MLFQINGRGWKSVFYWKDGGREHADFKEIKLLLDLGGQEQTGANKTAQRSESGRVHTPVWKREDRSQGRLIIECLSKLKLSAYIPLTFPEWGEGEGSEEIAEDGSVAICHLRSGPRIHPGASHAHLPES
jgi:hypothetical protein